MMRRLIPYCILLSLLGSCSQKPKEPTHSFSEQRKVSSQTHPALERLGVGLVLCTQSSENFKSATLPEEHIYSWTSSDQGKSWTKQGAISTPVAYPAWGSDLIAVDDRLYFVWTANTQTGKAILCSSSDGTTWSQPARVSGRSREQKRKPSLGGRGSTLYASWHEGSKKARIMASVSQDGGQTWATPTVVHEQHEKCPSLGEPVMLVDQRGRPHVIVEGIFYGPDGQLVGTLLHASSDDGVSWAQTPLNLGGTVHSPAGTVGQDGALRVVYVHTTQATPGATPVVKGPLKMISSSDGANWSRPTVIDAEETEKWVPRIASNGSDFLVVWQDSTGLLSSASADNCRSWSKPVKAGDTSTVGHTTFDFVIDGEKILLVWADEKEGADATYAVEGNLR